MANVFAIDPGTTTGWTYVEADGLIVPHGECDLEFIAGQMGGDENQQAFDLYKLISHCWPCAVVIEDFVPRQLNQQRWFLSPVRVTARVEVLLWRDKRRWLAQSPAMAKTTITDDYLKAIDQWRAGKPHANDAIRHALTYLRRLENHPEMHEHLLSPLGLDI